MLILKINGREQTRVPMYFQLTSESYERYKDNIKKAAEYTVSCKLKKQKPNLKVSQDFWEKAIRAMLVQNLFAAMCLEAFIYDYAATNFSDTYVKKHLDKLDLISKWIIIPKLILSKEFPKSGRVFAYLRSIKRERDKLVHSKSRPQLSDEEREKEMAEYTFKPSSKKNKDMDLEVNIFRQLVEILNTLKEMEEQSHKKQDWWEIVEES